MPGIPVLHDVPIKDAHVPPQQCPLVQSVLTAQCLPSAQAGQLPPPQSTSVSAPFFTLSVHDGLAQTWFVQILLWQSVPTLHWTQAPLPLQTEPLFWLQAVPAGDGGLDGTPAVQMSLVHWFPSTGTSVLSTIEMMEPAPLQMLSRQSPAIWLDTTVPLAVKLKPHTPAVQVRVWHSVSDPGQSAGVKQLMQVPDPLQTPPKQDVPDAVFVQVPPVQDMQPDAVPEQALLQQTPPAQWPLWHCASRPQTAPSPRSPRQTPGEPAERSQKSPAAQPASFMQLVVQAVWPQINGSHVCVTGGGQWPVPSQVAAKVSTPPEQLAERHDVDALG
jgi:hypothetical protein